MTICEMDALALETHSHEVGSLLQVNAPFLRDYTCCFPGFAPDLPLEA